MRGQRGWTVNTCRSSLLQGTKADSKGTWRDDITTAYGICPESRRKAAAIHTPPTLTPIGDLAQAGAQVDIGQALAHLRYRGADGAQRDGRVDQHAPQQHRGAAPHSTGRACGRARHGPAGGSSVWHTQHRRAPPRQSNSGGRGVGEGPLPLCGCAHVSSSEGAERGHV